MDIEVEQEQEVGVLQQQIEAPMGVVRHEIRGSKTVPWPTPFWIRDDMIPT